MPGEGFEPPLGVRTGGFYVTGTGVVQVRKGRMRTTSALPAGGMV